MWEFWWITFKPCCKVIKIRARKWFIIIYFKVSFQLSPQWLYGNFSTWAQDVRLHVHIVEKDCIVEFIYLLRTEYIHVLYCSRDHYFTQLAWQDNRHVFVAWSNRAQNRSIITLCNITTGQCQPVSIVLYRCILDMCVQCCTMLKRHHIWYWLFCFSESYSSQQWRPRLGRNSKLYQHFCLLYKRLNMKKRFCLLSIRTIFW